MKEITTIDNPQSLQNLCEIIIAEAKKLGASQSEVSITTTKGFSVSAHNGDVESVEYNQDKFIELTVYFGKRSGSASLSDIRLASIKSAVEAACHIAKYTDEDHASGLAEKDELGFNYPSIQLAYPWNITVTQAIEMVCECERIGMAQDKRILNAEACDLSTHENWEVYANSHGFFGCYPHTRHEISCILVAKGKKDMQRDFNYTVAIDPELLDSIDSIAKKAASRTINRLDARSIASTKSPVIYVAEEARSLIGHFAGAISGSHIYRKSSFLLDHLGKRIFPEGIHITEEPHLPKALGSSPFDDDGVMTRANTFIEDGILSSYSLDVYSARKLGMKTTADSGGVHNLCISTGNKDLKTLIQTMGKGLVITELMGQGVNGVTGDYSRGASGYWVENGEIQFPVQEVTVAGKLKDMYGHIVEIGNDIDTRGNVRTGSILISEMSIAGN